MTRTFIALGGNLGSVEQNFQQAIALINELPRSEVETVSSILTSQPVGASAGEPFKNAVLKLETVLEPLELLKSLQSIENSFGRDRTVRWGPRPVDLDMILYGDQLISLPELIIPHPASWYRRFVLVPMAEIAPDVIHPEKKVSFKQLKEHFERKPLIVSIAGRNCEQRTEMIKNLGHRFTDILFQDWNQGDPGNSELPAIIIWTGKGTDQGLTFESLPELPRNDLSVYQDEIYERAVEVVQSIMPV